MAHDDIVIVGAGAAGLACAAALARAGLPSVVLERAGHVGAAWRGRYDSLRLNSGRTISALPGLRYPRGTGTFPGRDDVVEYLERYAQRHGVQVRTGVAVDRIDRARDGRWALRTSTGTVTAGDVVVATGRCGTPVRPHWFDPERFAGPLLHSADYRNPAPFVGAEVLVVGAGASGVEIATELERAGASHVLLSVRAPVNLVPRAFGAAPGVRLLFRLPPSVADAQMRPLQRLAVGDLRAVGLRSPDEGPFTLLRRGVEPTPVDRSQLRALRQGRIRVVPAVVSLHEHGARLSDGSDVRADAIIAATGYRPGLDALVGHLGVLDEHGLPTSRGPGGLHFLGFRSVPGQLVFLGDETRQLARHLRAERRLDPPAPATRRRTGARVTSGS